MADTLNILLKADKFDDSSLKKIHDTLINFTLFEDFKDFDYFSLWGEDNESYFGKDNPEKMKEDVVKWNERIDKRMKSLEKKIAVEMSVQKVDSLTDFKVCGDVPYLLWEFRQALCAMTNLFSYGQNYLYRDDYEGWCTYLPKRVKEDAMLHPEDYVMIQCFYH